MWPQTPKRERQPGKPASEPWGFPVTDGQPFSSWLWRDRDPAPQPLLLDRCPSRSHSLSPFLRQVLAALGGLAALTPSPPSSPQPRPAGASPPPLTWTTAKSPHLRVLPWSSLPCGSRAGMLPCAQAPHTAPNSPWLGPLPATPMTELKYRCSLLCPSFCTQSVAQSCVQVFATPGTVAHRAPPFMGFSRQEYWSGLPFPSSGDLPTQESNPGLLHCRQML